MPAVYIDAAVVDGSRNRLTPSPAYPIIEPDLLPSIASASIVAPSAFTFISSPSIISPSSIPFVSGVALSAPSALTAIAAATIAAASAFASIGEPTLSSPVTFTAIAAASYSAPFLITRIAEPTLTAPSVITPKAGTSDTPPYALNHARILYNNLLLTSVVNASGGTNPSYTLIPNTYQSWAFTVSTTMTILFTMAAPVGMDTVCISVHNLSGCTVTVTYDTDLVDPFIAFGSPKVVTKNTPIMFHLSSSVSVRRLRVTIAGTGARQIGSIYAGIALQMQRPFFSGFDRYGDQSTLSTRMSAGGNIIAREVIRLGYSNSFKFEHLTDSWMQNYFEPFKYAAKTTPFAIAWNLLEYPDDVFFGMVDADINPVFMGIRNLYSAEFSMVSHGTV